MQPLSTQVACASLGGYRNWHLQQYRELGKGHSVPWHDAQLQPRGSICANDLTLREFQGVAVQCQRPQDGDVIAAAQAHECVILRNPFHVRQGQGEVPCALPACPKLSTALVRLKVPMRRML